jgi:hypothetical protein
MKKTFIKIFAATALLTTLNAYAQSQNPDPICDSVKAADGSFIQKRVHVWYSLNSKDTKYNWDIQISRLYENNVGFVDETCALLSLDRKIVLQPNTTKKVGMVVFTEKNFASTYAFMGVRKDEALAQPPPVRKYACIFVVAPYGPRAMDRMDWKMNSSDCSATDYGTVMNFK